jgi:formylmethanofuran dehydrogenase subunit E
MEGWGDGKQPVFGLVTGLHPAVKYHAMKTVPENEQEWNRLVRAENCRCPACGEFIRFDEREIYLDRNLCAYCAEMIPKRDN